MTDVWPVPRFTLSDLPYWFCADSTPLSQPSGYPFLRWHSCGASALASLCLPSEPDTSHSFSILIPGYFCSQTLRYLRSLPVHIYFYQLTSSLTPDYDQILKDFADVDIHYFVHVHYFGNIQSQKKSLEISRILGALLIEDCAHISDPYYNSSWVGDFLLFSPHKHFPLPKVSLLFSRINFSKLTRSTSHDYPFFWLIRNCLRRLFYSYRPPSFYKPLSSASSIYLDSIPSQYIKKVTSKYLFESRTFTNLRQHNFTLLLERLIYIPGWSPLHDNSSHYSPYLLGMLCDSKDIAESRFKLFNKKVQLVMKWPDLPSEINVSPSILWQCTELLDRTLFFFIHHQLSHTSWLSEVDNALILINH